MRSHLHKKRLVSFYNCTKYDKILASFTVTTLPCWSSLLLLLVHVISSVFVRIVGVLVGWWEVYPPLIPAREHTTTSLLTPQLKAQKYHTIEGL